MKKPIFRNCCCCCDLKVGCCIFVGLSLFFSVFELLQAIGSLGKSNYSSYSEYGYRSGYRESLHIPEWLKNFSILIYIVTIFTNILFFKGVSSNKPSLLKPFIICETIILIIITISILFVLPFLGEKAFFVFMIAAIFIGISAYMIACIYSLYVTMKNEPGISGGQVPQVIVQSQMPQNHQPQNVYYIVNPTPFSFPTSSPLNPSNHTAAINNSMNNGDEKLTT